MIESEQPAIELEGRVRELTGQTVGNIRNNHFMHHIRAKPEFLSPFRIEIDQWIVAIRFHL